MSLNGVNRAERVNCERGCFVCVVLGTGVTRWCLKVSWIISPTMNYLYLPPFFYHDKQFERKKVFSKRVLLNAMSEENTTYILGHNIRYKLLIFCSYVCYSTVGINSSSCSMGRLCSITGCAEVVLTPKFFAVPPMAFKRPSLMFSTPTLRWAVRLQWKYP